MSKPLRIIGIDPGTGVKSPTGFVDFDSDGEIYSAVTIGSKQKDTIERIREIAYSIFKRTNGEHDLICCETFMMRGKGGETLQRMIGATIGATTPTPVQEVYNTTVKRLIAGIGDGSKSEVAAGVARWFRTKGNEKSIEKINELIRTSEWDLLDAFAIGISGYLLYTEQAE